MPRRKIYKLEGNAELRYVAEPSYSKLSDKAGGKCSTVILGPLGLGKMGSDADSKLPKGITEARAHFPNVTLIAGHLLNADFGGDGKNNSNMTILSSKGNAAHKNQFETPVKHAVSALKKCYEVLTRNYVDIEKSKLKVGIFVSIEPTGHWEMEPPGHWVCTHLKCHAELSEEFDYPNMVDSNGEKLSESDDADKYYATVTKECSALVKEIEGYLTGVRSSIGNPIG